MSNQKNHFGYFLVIWLGDFVSTIGSGMTAFALSIHAYKLTHQASSATMVILFTFLPAFLLRPIGGVLADRISRPALMIGGSLGSAAGIALIICLTHLAPSKLFMIYPSVILSSLFVAFQNPAFKACVSDFLPKSQYSKASGLIQLSSSAQFLIAPLVAGFLMGIVGIHTVLLIDLGTFIFAALMVGIIWHQIKGTTEPREPAAASTDTPRSMARDLLDGLMSVVKQRGVFILVILISILLFYIGLIQALLTPMSLSFLEPAMLGTAQSICAIGMLASALVISAVERKIKNATLLPISLALMGLSFAFIGIQPSFFAIVIPGFLFFATIPFANSSIDVLIRQNIHNDHQGRAWAFISVMTYAGSMVAYAVSGFLADHVFNPLLMPSGAFANSLGRVFGTGPGRGIALMFFICGILVIVLAIAITQIPAIKHLEEAPTVKE